MIRTAVLGAGWVANARYLPVLRRLRDVDIVSVYDRHGDRAAATAGAHRVPHSSDDLHAVFAQQPEAVFVCTSPWSHAEITEQALQHGCHVLTEKPMAMNLDEASRMAAAAREADKLLCVSHNFLFSHAVQRSDRALGQPSQPLHIIGTQLSSDSRRLPDWHAGLPGGLLFDEIPHLLYVTQHYLGELELVAARQLQADTPAVTEVDLRGVRGTAHLSVVSGAPVSEWHVTIVGPGSVSDLDLFRDIGIRVPSDGTHRARDIMATSRRALTGHTAGFIGSGVRLLRKRLFWGHDVLIERFLAAIRTDAAPPVPIDEALNVVRLTDQILAALDAD